MRAGEDEYFDACWTEGVNILFESGLTPKKACRKIIGKWLYRDRHTPAAILFAIYEMDRRRPEKNIIGYTQAILTGEYQKELKPGGGV